jgi:UDP-glucose 4-epimerase
VVSAAGDAARALIAIAGRPACNGIHVIQNLDLKMHLDDCQPEFSAPRRSGVAVVTGAGGFIGSHIAVSLARSGWTVVGIGTNRSGKAIHDAVRWIESTVTDESLAQAAEPFGPPELVVHAAGGSSVGASLTDPQHDRARTVDSTAAVLEFVRRSKDRARLVVLSSAAVYGSAGVGPISESNSTAPVSPYGRHKQMSEALVRAAAEQDGLEAAIVRLFSVYGPGNAKQLLWDVTTRLLSSPPAITLSGHGGEIRDFLYIDDAVRLVACLARADGLAGGLVVNGGTGMPVTVEQIATALRDAVGTPTDIQFNCVVREGDPQTLLADIAVARQLSFVPTVSLGEGVARYVEWVRGVYLPRR